MDVLLKLTQQIMDYHRTLLEEGIDMEKYIFQTESFIYRWKSVPAIKIKSGEVGALFSPFDNIDEALFKKNDINQKYIISDLKAKKIEHYIEGLIYNEDVETLLSKEFSMAELLSISLPFSLNKKVKELNVYEKIILNIERALIDSKFIFFYTGGLSRDTWKKIVKTMYHRIASRNDCAALFIETGELNCIIEEFKYVQIKTSDEYYNAYQQTLIPKKNHSKWKLKE
jgi:hypothetical protein